MSIYYTYIMPSKPKDPARKAALQKELQRIQAEMKTVHHDFAKLEKQTLELKKKISESADSKEAKKLQDLIKKM